MTMRDCADGNTRDLLPDFVHGTLPATERARVVAHLAACADCAAELRLIESARAAFPVPALDVARIVSALPAARQASWGGGLRSRQWLLAAGVSFVALGVISVAAVRGVFGGGDANPSAAVASPRTPGVNVPPDGQPAPRQVTLAARESLARKSATVVGLSFGGGLADLSDEQLTTLLREIEALEVSPSAEPEPHATPIIPMREGGSYAR